ncbi:periplasmic heavy metal sensor [Pirellulales bacterium]|nr:periplasmic heavy metal sensor [Pirellulales bacterium]
MSTYRFRSWAIILTLASIVGGAAAAEEKHHDPLAKHFCPPELIFQNREALELTSDQIRSIEDEVKAIQEKAPRFKEAVHSEVRKLDELLQSANPEESAVLAQLDEVLNREREMKRLQFTLLFRIRAQLTPAQRDDLQELKAETIAKGERMKKRIQGKVLRMQKIVEARMKAGRPPHEAVELIKSFQELIKDKRPQAAEAVLDKALEILDESEE